MTIPTGDKFYSSTYGKVYSVQGEKGNIFGEVTNLDAIGTGRSYPLGSY